MTATEKTCTVCHQTKPLDDFPKQRGGKYGRRGCCFVCDRARQKAHRDADLEATRASGRRRAAKQRAADPDAARAKNRRWYAENQGKATAAMKRWREENRDVISQKRRAAYAEDPSAAREGASARRALKRAAAVGAIDFATLWFTWKDCYLCGDRLDGFGDIDHVVPLSRGGAHSMDNLRPVHDTCNGRKSDKLLSELSWYNGPTGLGAVSPQHQLGSGVF